MIMKLLSVASHLVLDPFLTVIWNILIVGAFPSYPSMLKLVVEK